MGGTGHAVRISLALFAFTSVAHAQQSPRANPANTSPAPASPGPTDEARTLFDQGVHFMEDGRFAEALDRFERARTIRETPAVIFNLAIAQRGLGHYVDAAAGLERYLSVAADRIDAQRRAEIQTLLNELHGAIVHARVTLSVTSATLSVDGREIDASRVPSNGTLDLDPGTHTFRAVADGFRPAESVQVTHPGDTVQVVLTLERIAQTGTLRVETTVADSRIFVDRRSVGSGEYEATLPAGPHEVEVRAQGYVPYSRSVMLRHATTETVHVSLDRQGTSIATRWWFWTGIGVIVVAGATAATIAAITPEPAYPGTLGSVVQAIQPR